MWNVTVCFLVYIFCTWLTSVTPLTQTVVLLKRLKRQESLIRRLESLTIRMEHLEVDFRKEQEKSHILQAVVKKLTTEIDESRTKILTEQSDKISETALQDVRLGLRAEKERGLQLAGSQQECKEHIIKTSKLVRSLENAVQECKDQTIRTDTVVSAFGNSVEDIRVNMSRLSENMSELKMNWTVWSNLNPEKGGGEAVTDTATCSQCIPEAELRVSNMVHNACHKNFTYLYFVLVKSVKDESSLRKIYMDLLDAAGIGWIQHNVKTTVVMTESRNCNRCSKFTPGSRYLIMTQDHLTESTQKGKPLELILNDRSIRTRMGTGKNNMINFSMISRQFLGAKCI